MKLLDYTPIDCLKCILVVYTQLIITRLYSLHWHSLKISSRMYLQKWAYHQASLLDTLRLDTVRQSPTHAGASSQTW
jgi:hypothetical protein